MGLVALITDYGEQDYYVGALKGVLLSRAPNVIPVDVTHDIGCFDILHGGFVLWQVWRWFPVETVFLAVVDPGVGTGRRILIGRYERRYVVAPDNGLVTLVHQDFACEALTCVADAVGPAPMPAATFHGRDVMAPLAAALANGQLMSPFGEPIECPVCLPVSIRADVGSDTVRGQVLHVDHFGTLVTNIRPSDLHAPRTHRDRPRVSVGDKDIGPVRETFADVPPGQPLALFGSCGLLEIAVNQGNADKLFDRHSDVLVSGT